MDLSYLIKESHHLHKRCGVALLTRNALNLRLDALHELIQCLQRVRNLRQKYKDICQELIHSFQGVCNCVKKIQRFIMYLCLYHPDNGRDTDNVIKWTLSPCY